MRKYIIIGSVFTLVLAAVSVFALQGRGERAPTAREVAPLAADTSTGCAAGGAGCAQAGGASGCSTSGGGCGAPVDPARSAQRIDGIKAYLAAYYRDKAGLQDVRIEVEDFGCHQEATVLDGGRVVERLSISGSRITKIEG